jgi:hypothetical protein
LQQQAEQHPDRMAVVFSATEDRLSFSELLDQVSPENTTVDKIKGENPYRESMYNAAVDKIKGENPYRESVYNAAVGMIR